jgi:hypothetical protein
LRVRVSVRVCPRTPGYVRDTAGRRVPRKSPTTDRPTAPTTTTTAAQASRVGFSWVFRNDNLDENDICLPGPLQFGSRSRSLEQGLDRSADSAAAVPRCGLAGRSDPAAVLHEGGGLGESGVADVTRLWCEDGPASRTHPSRLNQDVAAGDLEAAHIESFRCRLWRVEADRQPAPASGERRCRCWRGRNALLTPRLPAPGSRRSWFARCAPASHRRRRPA